MFAADPSDVGPRQWVVSLLPLTLAAIPVPVYWDCGLCVGDQYGREGGRSSI